MRAGSVYVTVDVEPDCPPFLGTIRFKDRREAFGTMRECLAALPPR